MIYLVNHNSIFFRNHFIVFLLISFFSVNVLATEKKSGIATLTKKSEKIVLSFEVPKDAKSIIIEYRSSRNKNVSKLTDVSPDNPKGINPGMEKGKEIWFPVIDIQLVNNLQAIAVFENVGEDDKYCWNSNFWDQCNKLEKELTFDTHLEHWENHIFVESETASLKDFFLRQTLDVSSDADGRQKQYEMETLSNDWSGEIRINSQSNKGVILIEKFTIGKKLFTGSINQKSGLTRANILSSLRQSVQYVLDNQNKNPLSPTYGGLFLFYDLDAKTYRRSDWIWTYGPAIKLLLGAAEIPELASEFGYENLVKAAGLIGEASLRFQMLDKNHPAYGLVICRYDPKVYYPGGFTGFLSPADAHFLAGWGWIPLYEATGDSRFLDAAVLQTEQIGRILTYGDVIEQDYILKAGKWKNWTMDESGFGMEGFAEVYKVTQNKTVREMGRKYIDGLINILETPDGLWYKNYHRNQPGRANDGWPASTPQGVPQVMKEGQTARGNGWAMIGLLASHRMMPEGDQYLNKAIKLADNLIDQQLDNGAFPFNLYRPVDEVGISDKGTPLWSMLLYQLYEFTKDPKHLKAAQKALQWCMENQYAGEDEHLKLSEFRTVMSLLLVLYNL